MAGFTFSSRGAECDGVDPAVVAAAEGTPLYVYSAALIVDRYRALDAALGACPHRVHYALKANSTLGLVRLLRSAGSAVDANSGGEIAVALRAGVDPGDIVFTGVGKTGAELEDAVRIGVGVINAESAGELARIDRIAAACGARARVAVRINPGIEADSHPGIVTGGPEHKFGVPIEQAGAVCREAAARPGLDLVGVHAHVGSQLTDLDAVAGTASTISRFARDLRAAGVSLQHVDLGGGLGISYDGSPELPVAAWARTLVEAVAPTGLTLLVEPGRWIVGPAGALVATVGGRQAAAQRPLVRRARRRHERAAAPGPVRREAPPRAAAGTRRTGRDVRRGGADLRDDRRDPGRVLHAPAGGGGPVAGARRRRLRIGDGVELQSARAAGRSARGGTAAGG